MTQEIKLLNNNKLKLTFYKSNLAGYKEIYSIAGLHFKLCRLKNNPYFI